MKTLSKQELNEILDFNEITTVEKRSDAYDAIENHFGTLKCKSDDFNTKRGEMWCVYPPSGVYSQCLYILIKI